MTYSAKGLLFFVIIVASLHDRAFSQRPESARSRYDTGILMIDKNPDKAFEALEDAVQLARKEKSWELYTLVLNTLATRYLEDNGERRGQVFSWLKEAVPLLKDSPHTDGVAAFHYNLAEYFNLVAYEIENPIFHYEQAKRIWISLHGESSAEVAKCYHGLGDVYKYNKFDFLEAENCYEKALLVREKIGFAEVEPLYKNYYSLAATNRSQRDFEKAISYGSKTLELAKKLPPFRLERSHGMVANIYRDLGDLEQAKKYYLNALAINVKTRDRENEAWYYVCLGETFKMDSAFQTALNYFKKAYILYKDDAIKDQYLFVRLLIYMGDTYAMLGDESNFRKIANEAFKELAALKKSNSREAAQLWLTIGNHHYRKSHYDSSLFYFQKALNAAVPSFKSQDVAASPTEDEIGFRYYINEILTRKASAWTGKFAQTKNAQHLKQALTCLKLAENLLSTQRNTLDMEEAKWVFLEENFDLYETILSNVFEGIRYLPSDTINSLAFQYFEQSKARSLADALTVNERTKKISGQDSLLRVHSELKRQLFAAQDRINRELENINASDKISKLRADVVMLDQKIHACKLAIEKKYPGYFNVKYGYRKAQLDDVQKVLKSKNQLLLEYFWGNKSVYALGITADAVLFHRVGSPESVDSLATLLVAHLTDPAASFSSPGFKSFTSHAHKLYNLLVKPFGELMVNKERIHVIPDGSIGQIPFEILLQDNVVTEQVNYRSLNYLLKSFTIGYAYSSTNLIHNASARRVDNPSLLAIGFTRGRTDLSSPKMEMLAGAEQELQELEKRFNEGKFLTGDQATESNFKNLAPDFDIIHLAIHGMSDVRKSFAGSLFFDSQTDDVEDGELHSYELYGLKLNASMAVLSACESGLGKGYKGEGMISMASAFTYSGCENILMSLWKVNDQLSTELMNDFYEGLSTGLPIDEALRKAKLEYLNAADELTAHPKGWAPLVAYGNLNNIFQKERSKTLIVIILSITIAALLLYKIYKTRN